MSFGNMLTRPLPPAAPGVTPAMAAQAFVATPTAVAAAPIIDIRAVTRVYDTGRIAVHALAGVDLCVGAGEFVAIIGPSGSGKSTLMNVIGCLDRPTSGSYRLAGIDVSSLGDDGLAEIRSRQIGFVFQSFNLLPRTSALDNVATPLMYQGVGLRKRRKLATEALKRLGLGDRLDHEPTELSGGQQQRVAVARAIVTDPALILADEPTGNLDTHSGHEVMALFRELHHAGRTIVLITHEQEVAEQATAVIAPTSSCRPHTRPSRTPPTSVSATASCASPGRPSTTATSWWGSRWRRSSMHAHRRSSGSC